MTLLANVKERLSRFFTLRTEKDKVWLKYLKDEIDYVNGGVYLHTRTPVYHKQKVSGGGFTVETTTEANCYIILEQGAVTTGQANSSYATLNGNKLSINPYVKNGVYNVRFDNESQGSLKIFVPPYNTATDNYQGFEYEEEIRKQSMELISLTSEDNNSKLNMTVNVGNGMPDQEVRFFTFYRDGTVHFAESKFLTSGQTSVSVTGLNVGNQDDGVRIDLKPIKKYGAFFLGRQILIKFTGNN